MFCSVALCWGGNAHGCIVGKRFIVHQKENGYERVIRIAEKEVGVREAGAENCGRRVEEYLKYVGFGKGSPWCAALVSFVFREAGFVRPRTAWCPALFPEGRVVSAPALRPGLVFGIYFPALGRVGHCGIVAGTFGDQVFTIEGNTSVVGSREGDGVYRRIRHKRTIAKFSDWVKSGL